MNPIHQAFAKEPALPLTLPLLFDALERLEPDERFACMSHVYQVILLTPKLEVVAPDHDTGYEILYQRFKDRCLSIVYPNGPMFPGFLAYGMVAQTLAWLATGANEEHMRHVIENNRREISTAETRMRRGEISQSEFEGVRSQLEEVNNNLPSDRRIREERYNNFCKNVVRGFLSYPPDETE